MRLLSTMKLLIKGLIINLGLKTPLNKNPLLLDIFF